MGHSYLAPTLEQVLNSKLKCAVIWYYEDEGAFFSSAVRGALADLRYGYRWEADAVTRAAIVQRFIEADLKTDDYFFKTDCEIIDALLDDGDAEEMAINVTVNQECGCGCGSGGGGAYVPEYPNETELTLPIVPIQPPNDEGQTGVPEGFDNREEYDVYKCAYATQLVDDFTESVGNLQVISGLTAGITLVAAYGVVTSASTYAAVVAGIAAAGLSATGGLLLLGAAMIALLGFGSVAYDKFAQIFDELTAMRADFICEVYNSESIPQARQIFIDRYGTAVTNLGLDDGLTAGLSNIVDGIVDALIPSEIIIGLFQLYKDFGVSDFDCSTCGGGSGSATFTFDADEQGWNFLVGRSSYDAVAQALSFHPKSGNSPDPTTITGQHGDFTAIAGLAAGTPIEVTGVSFDLVNGSLGDYFGHGKTVTFQIRFQDATTWTSPHLDTAGNHVLSGFPVKELRLDAGGELSFVIYGYSNGSSGNSDCKIDNIQISYNEI
jgi:hypothetical protein